MISLYQSIQLRYWRFEVLSHLHDPFMNVKNEQTSGFLEKNGFSVNSIEKYTK